MSDTVSFRDLALPQRGSVEAILRAGGVFRTAEVDVALEVFDAFVAQPHRDYSMVGAFACDELLGFACYGPTPCTANTWDCYWIAVAPARQQLGIGTRMLREVERRVLAAAARMMVVVTSSTGPYAPARALYERNGYEPVSCVPDFYAPGDDQIIYIKRFQA